MISATVLESKLVVRSLRRNSQTTYAVCLALVLLASAVCVARAPPSTPSSRHLHTLSRSPSPLSLSLSKGHLGYETTDHLPINRGFLSHVGYLGGSEGYEYGGGDANATKGKHDLWHDRAPGIDVVPEMFYSANYYTKTAVGIITKHAAMHTATSTAKPLFLYLPYQNVHSPNTLPPAWETHTFPKFGNGEVDLHTYANMLNMLDSGMKNVTAALKSTGMWANTLLVFSADNGGIGKFGNNHPLRGHKHDPWEGGIRATAFISGGFFFYYI